MKPKTVRLRRSRPSALSLALALMFTMLFVYFASLSAAPREKADAAAVQTGSTAELRMEGLDAAFSPAGYYENMPEARIQAAKCTQNGGAGLILADGDRFAVIKEALPPDSAPEGCILRSASGLTLRTSGPTGDIAALSDMLSFLRSQASETGALAASIENGDTDANSVRTLLDIYHTRGQRVLSTLQAIEGSDVVVARLISAGENALAHIEAAAALPEAGRLRLLHAAACAEWIDMIEDFTGKTVA